MSDYNRRTFRNTMRAREGIEQVTATTNSNLILRSRPPPRPEFYPQRNKRSKTSAGNFSDGLNARSKTTFMDMSLRAQKASAGNFSDGLNARSKTTFMDMSLRAQKGKGNAIDARSNLSIPFEAPMRTKSREIGQFIVQPPLPELEPRTNSVYKASVSAPAPRLPPPRSVNENKPVNWRLACFMANEYLTRGTLLGRPWPPPPPQDSNTERLKKKNKSNLASVSDEESPESKREKESLYHTLADFLRAGDVHIPGIVNPSQLVAWLGLKM